MVRQYSSVAVETTLTSGINDLVGTMVVGSTSGFPLSFPYTLVIDPDNGSKEVVEVTAAASTTLTITRGVDGTSAVSHSLGAVVEHAHSARDFREPQQHIAATSDVHGVSGALFGANDSIALTNKDLSSGSNTFPSSLATLGGIQTLTNKDLSSGTNTFPSSLATDVEVASAVSTGVSTHADLTTGVHGVGGGAVVGTTLTQTLTGKTLTSPAITNPNISGTVTGTPAFGDITATSLNLMPAGTVLQGVWAAAPAGFLLCDGSAVSRSTYATLFALIGTTYGAGDNVTTFNLPNLTNKFVRGGATAGATGGSDTHTHSLGSSARAHIYLDTGLGRIYSRQVSGDSWTPNKRATGVAIDSTPLNQDAGAALEGNTNSGSSLPAYVQLLFVIKT